MNLNLGNGIGYCTATGYCCTYSTKKTYDKGKVEREAKEELITLGNKYLSKPPNLGKLFRKYLRSPQRKQSYIDNPEFPNQENLKERLATVSDADIANFMEMYKEIIDNEKFVIN